MHWLDCVQVLLLVCKEMYNKVLVLAVSLCIGSVACKKERPGKLDLQCSALVRKVWAQVDFPVKSLSYPPSSPPSN